MKSRVGNNVKFDKKVKEILVNMKSVSLIRYPNYPKYIVDDIEKNSGIIRKLSSNFYSFYNLTFQEHLVCKLLYEAVQKDERYLILASKHFWESRWLEIIKRLLSLLLNYLHNLLMNSMKFIPEDLGSAIGGFYGKEDKIIILLEDNYANCGARLNQTRMLKAMISSNCVKLITSAGATSRVDTSILSKFPVREIGVDTAFHLFKSMMLTAEEFCTLFIDSDFKIWGIEDEELYKKQLNLYAEGDLVKMSELHKQVPPIYIKNTLKKMSEESVSIAVLTTGLLDMPFISKELQKMNITHFWIRGKEEGESISSEQHDKLLKGEYPSPHDILDEDSSWKVDKDLTFDKLKTSKIHLIDPDEEISFL